MDTSVFITDNNIVIDDTDSDTSSTSTADELKVFSNEIKHSQNIKLQLIEQFVNPIQSNGFYNKTNSQEIEDGFELALLRLVHIWFSSDGVINFTNLTKYMDLNKTVCKEIEEFFIDNPGVMSDSDFYSTDAGIAIRTVWYEFLSAREFFKYVHETHQLVPTNENFFAFVNQFFPLVHFSTNTSASSELNEQDKLNEIYNAFSFGQNKFHVQYSTYTKTENQMIHKGFIHNIFVNNIELFALESAQIRKFVDLDKIYWTKTELRYS